MKRLALDKKDKRIRDFVQALGNAESGSILELRGKAVLKVVPVNQTKVNRARLKAAILKRRDESRKLNLEWEAADQQLWSNLPESKG